MQNRAPVLLGVFTILFLYQTTFAQETSISVALPQVGDVHYYKLDNLPEDIDLDIEGRRNAWNLTMLNAPTAHELKFLEPSKSDYGNYFKGADLFSQDLWQNEKFYDKIGNGLFLVGEVRRTDREKNNPLLITYSDPAPVYSEQYSRGKEISYQSKWETIFNGEELGITGDDRNSLYKIECTDDIEERNDQAGTLFLPRQRFEVIKNEKSIYSTYRLFKNIGSDQWTPIRIDQYARLPIDIQQSRKEVLFISNKSPEWIARINLDEHGDFKSALFKSERSEVMVSGAIDKSNFFLYPNPTFGLVRLDFVNLQEGSYFLEVYNIIGKKLWSGKYQIDGYTTIREDLSFLNKGTYLYSLIDQNGQKLFTKRMAIITP